MPNTQKILAVSFLEGGIVMIAELAAAKILAPYFGTSVDVWAATLATTLGGLAAGYALGGYISKQYKSSLLQILRWILTIAAVLMFVMPYTSKISLLLLDLHLGTGAIIALLFFLFPSLVCLGASSPIIINLVNGNDDQAGHTAGRVYSISTVGGILFTIICGFYLLPYLGIKMTLTISSVLFMLGVGGLLYQKEKAYTLSVIVLFTLSVFVSISASSVYNPKFKVLHESDGLLGNIKVIDHTSEAFTRRPQMGRGLVVNNTLQSYIALNDQSYSIWEWAHYIPSIASCFEGRDNALLVGLGGGTVYKQLTDLNYNVKVVEIDKRIRDLGVQYFGVPDDINIEIDDARHYINQNDNKYDIIVYDAFLSESPPEHLLTREGLSMAQEALTRDGALMINFFGFIEGDNGYASRSLIKTLMSLDFKVDVVATPGEEHYRNLIIVAYTGEAPDYDKVKYQEKGKVLLDKLKGQIIPTNSLDMSDAEMLIDDRPALSIYYQAAAQSWRKGYNDIYTKQLHENQ